MLVMQSFPNVPGPPVVLAIARDEPSSSEPGLAKRIAVSCRKQQVRLLGPVALRSRDDLSAALVAHPGANCLLLIEAQAIDPQKRFSWEWLPAAQDARKLVAFHAAHGAPGIERVQLHQRYPWVSLAVLSKPSMSAHQAGLFYPEFFAELTTHCPTEITPALARFCFLKANRLAPAQAEIWT